MICKKCGNEIDDNAKICDKCEERISGEMPEAEEQDSKYSLGIVLGLFHGLVGLFIGLCLYPSGSITRKSFLSGWLFALVLRMVLVVLFVILIRNCYSDLICALKNALMF